MHKHQGFILLAVLIFMQIYALLGLSALEQVFLTQKLVSDQKTKRLLFNEAERMMRQLESRFNISQWNCRIAVMPMQQLRRQPLMWWDTSACTAEGAAFLAYYVLEVLDEDACAQTPDGNPVLAVYYRITLLLMQKQDDAMRIMLQRTVAVENHDLEHCDSQRHSVNWGPLSWTMT